MASTKKPTVPKPGKIGQRKAMSYACMGKKSK